MNTAILTNYNYFTQNRSDLYCQYPNKYIVLKNCGVIGAYNNPETALRSTLKTEKYGTFIVQFCIMDCETAVCRNDNVKFD